MTEEFGEGVCLQLKLTKNIMEMEHNKYLKPHGISSEQGLLAKCVYEMPGITQTQIAEYLSKDKTTITRMIDALVKKGQLERRSSEEDRRVFHIYVTPQTAKKVEEISPHFKKNQEALKEIIGKEDYQTTIKVLHKIQKYYIGLNR
jgi:DNA-binding MarR family transcriptional regulator